MEENEPGLVSDSVYFSENDSRMSVVHVYADPASLDWKIDPLRLPSCASVSVGQCLAPR